MDAYFAAFQWLGYFCSHTSDMWEEQEKMEEETETEWGGRSGREEGLGKAGGVFWPHTDSFIQYVVLDSVYA